MNFACSRREQNVSTLRQIVQTLLLGAADSDASWREKVTRKVIFIGRDGPLLPMTGVERVVFAIRGLDCASCAIDLGRALRKLPGILEVNVNYVIDKGFVEFDPERTSWEAVAKALARRGYPAVKTR